MGTPIGVRRKLGIKIGAKGYLRALLVKFMKNINIIFLLLISNVIIGMEAERKSLASFFCVEKCVQNEDICTVVAQQHVSDQKWWYMDKEIQYINQGCLDASYQKKNSFAFVHFNKACTEIIIFPGGIGDCFICVCDRKSGKERERIFFEDYNEVNFSYPQIWADRLYSSTRAPQVSYNEGLWCGEYSFCEESGGLKEALVVVKREYMCGRVTNINESKACVWDRIEGKESLQLVHDGPVNMAHFNPQGIEIITASDDCTMRLWHSKTGQELLRIAYGTCVQSAWFNEMGTEMVVATDDGNIQIFAQYKTDNLPQVLLKKLLHLWLQLQKPSKKIDSPEKLLDNVAQLLSCDKNEMNITWQSFPKHMQKAMWLSMHNKIQKYGK